MSEVWLEIDPPQVVFQEVPGEISLGLTVYGCPHRCRGCHSSYSWKTGRGTPLTETYLQQLLSRYRGLISCVCFFGGDWQPEALLAALQTVRRAGLATCLYTGAEQVASSLRAELDYLKTGPWIAALGGLDAPTTNQRFWHLPSQTLLNHIFIKRDPDATPARTAA